jgi:hypothetical protein
MCDSVDASSCQHALSRNPPEEGSRDRQSQFSCLLHVSAFGKVIIGQLEIKVRKETDLNTPHKIFSNI